MPKIYNICTNVAIAPDSDLIESYDCLNDKRATTHRYIMRLIRLHRHKQVQQQTGLVLGNCPIQTTLIETVKLSSLKNKSDTCKKSGVQ